MRTKVVLLVALPLILSLPVALWADPTSFESAGGKITSNGSVLTLAGSSVLGGGSLTLSTGALISGSLATGAVLGAGGSILVMTPSGAEFSGAFSGPVAWKSKWVSTAGPNGAGAWYYTLSGAVRGQLGGSGQTSGTLALLTSDVPNGSPFAAFVNLNQGLLTISVPEPGSLSLVATGLISLIGLARRRVL